MIGNKRIKLVMAGFLIAGATVTNITGVGSFADEIATFGTYNVYHSQSLQHIQHQILLLVKIMHLVEMML